MELSIFGFLEGWCNIEILVFSGGATCWFCGLVLAWVLSF